MFQIVDRAALYPAVTILGLQSDVIVDTGVELAGCRIYLGRREIDESARLLGYLEPAVAARLQAELADLAEQNERLKEQLRKAKPIIDAATAAAIEAAAA